MPEDKFQAHGNADVVAALETILAEAKQGLMAYVAIMGLTEPEDVSAYFGGSIHLLPRAHKDIGTLQEMMKAKIMERDLPPRDPALGADYACYNACVAPLSFDFLAWMVDAEMTRVRKGAPAPLKVHFWFGRNREDDPRITKDSEPGLGLPSRKIMLENVCRPMLKLIGAVEDEKATGGWFTAVCTTRGIVEAAKAGEPVPKFKAPKTTFWHDHRGYVTITLREAVDWPHRNSSIGEWLRIADYLKERGERVVFVRETSQAYEFLGPYATWPPASIDLSARMALYQSAKANLFVSNGPASLAWFSDKPWLMLTEPEPDVAPEGQHIYAPNTRKAWRENMGIEVGEQWPWSRPDQRIVWAKQDYETIVEAWEQWIEPALQQEKVA